MHVIITGLPASGKSSVGKAMAPALGLELLDKDDILESMFDERVAGSQQQRTSLSRDADEILRQRAFQSNGAVIVSWWRHPKSRIDTGTPTEWLWSLSGARVQVHCKCDALVAAKRFQSRKRHPGHLDDSKTFEEIFTSFQEFENLGAIDLGIPVIDVDTSEPVDERSLSKRIVLACGFNKTDK